MRHGWITLNKACAETWHKAGSLSGELDGLMCLSSLGDVMDGFLIYFFESRQVHATSSRYSQCSGERVLIENRNIKIGFF